MTARRVILKLFFHYLPLISKKNMSLSTSGVGRITIFLGGMHKEFCSMLISLGRPSACSICFSLGKSSLCSVCFTLSLFTRLLSISSPRHNLIQIQNQKFLASLDNQTFQHESKTLYNELKPEILPEPLTLLKKNLCNPQKLRSPLLRLMEIL